MLDVALKLASKSQPRPEKPFEVKLLGVFRVAEDGKLIEDRLTRDGFAERFESLEHPGHLLDLLCEPLVFLFYSKRFGGQALFVPFDLWGSLKDPLPACDAVYLYRQGRRAVSLKFVDAFRRRVGRAK